MTDTERIATALLGWRKIGRQFNNLGCDLYSKDPACTRHDDSCTSVYRKTGKQVGPGRDSWPDFTTLEGCRLFEDALAKLPTCNRYVDILDGLTQPDPPRSTDGWEDAWAIVLATPAQRVTACIKVLDEAGL